MVGKPTQTYTSVGPVQAKLSENSSTAGAPPTIEEVNVKLQELAAQMGANAVINVTYKRGMGVFSWNVLTGIGEAVILESDDKACPICAETIKKAALKCRFCGADLA
jgi:hypothetical protein